MADPSDPTDGRARAGRYPEGTLLAYRGKKGCDSILCDHRVLTGDEIPDPEEECLGWHCGRCDEPCGLSGHVECLKQLEEEPDDSAE